METFTEIRTRLGLHRFVDSPLGTVYSVPFVPGAPFVMVRHFDSELSPDMVQAYVDLIRAAHDWVQRRPRLVEAIRIELPTDLGSDYVVRKRHVYSRSLDSYTWDEPSAPEPSEEVERMRTALRAEMSHSQDPRDLVVESVLARSLVEPSAKTYEADAGFVVVEPKLTVRDVKRWAELLGVPHL